MEQKPSFTFSFTQTADSLFAFRRFEAYHDGVEYKSNLKKSFFIVFGFSLLLFITAIFITPNENKLIVLCLYLAFLICTALYYYYQYKKGFLSEYSLVKQLDLSEEEKQKRKKDYTITFYRDNAYITAKNENRMFYYRDIEFIQRLDHIVIFYFYLKNENHLKDFTEFVVDLKHVPKDKSETMLQFTQVLKKQYKINSLSDLDKLV